MTVRTELPPEEPTEEKYARFNRLLTAIAGVPKAAIYKLDPKLRPAGTAEGSEVKTPEDLQK
jgi:hypothetical protein